MDIMSRNESNLSKFSNARSATIVEQGSSIRPAKKLLDKVEVGKEYLFTTGRHSAIVRKTEEGKLQYLELQSSFRNGWSDFEYENVTKWGTYKRTLSDTLKDRFACNRLSLGISYLTDISCFEGDNELRDILGYITTEPSQQKKGSSGGIK